MRVSDGRIGARIVLLTVVVALVLASCSSGGSSAKSSPSPTTVKVDLATAGEAKFTTGGSVGQVYVTGAPAGDDLELVRTDGVVIAHAPADAHGSVHLPRRPGRPATASRRAPARGTRGEHAG